VRSDICCDSDIASLVRLVDHQHGQLDILVNNAGRLVAPADWIHVTRMSFLETLQTNLVGPCLLTQGMLPLLELAEKPVVLFVGSTYGTIGDPYVLAYSAAKARILSITKAMSKALAPRIRVNAILPGHIDTEMTRAGSPEFIERVVSETPLKRIGSTEEIAKLVKFLVSDECPFITGESIVVDGGDSLP
jgi:NAD(P)-dependent dehydrogenase (short-subunit alcohol dehydrogenase family)